MLPINPYESPQSDIVDKSTPRNEVDQNRASWLPVISFILQIAIGTSASVYAVSYRIPTNEMTWIMVISHLIVYGPLLIYFYLNGWKGFVKTRYLVLLVLLMELGIGAVCFG